MAPSKSNTEEEEEEERRQLIERIEEFKRSNAFLWAENDLLEGFISRSRVPPDSAPRPPGGDTAGRPGSPPQGAGGYQLLSLGQKLFVAEKEVAETQRDIEEAEERSELIQDQYMATREAAELRLSEVRRERFEFERDVVKRLEGKQGRMDTEKVLRYIEDGIKRKEAQVEKLCSNNQKWKAHCRKLQLQLTHKKDSDEDMKEFNLELLRVENSVLQENIATRKQELQRLTQLAATVRKSLGAYKNKLQDATRESEDLSSGITKRQETLVNMEEETRHVEKECAKEKATCERLSSQLAEYSVPDVMEYVLLKDHHKRLRHTFHAWERKVEISEMELKSYTKAWKREKADSSSANNTKAGVSPGKPSAVLRLPKIN